VDALGARGVNPLRELTKRQMQVARAIAIDCLNSKAAAIELGITYRTVETHRMRILLKCGLSGGGRYNAIAQLARMMALAERGT
jgi:FixJ family two-component response regulator